MSGTVGGMQIKASRKSRLKLVVVRVFLNQVNIKAESFSAECFEEIKLNKLFNFLCN